MYDCRDLPIKANLKSRYVVILKMNMDENIMKFNDVSIQNLKCVVTF